MDQHRVLFLVLQLLEYLDVIFYFRHSTRIQYMIHLIVRRYIGLTVHYEFKVVGFFSYRKVNIVSVGLLFEVNSRSICDS